MIRVLKYRAMTRRSFLKGVLLGAGGLVFYAAARKMPLPVQWTPRLKAGVKGTWEGDEYVLRYGRGVVRLNTTGGEVAEMMSTGRPSASQMARALVNKYGIPRQRAEADVREILGHMDRLGLLA